MNRRLTQEAEDDRAAFERDRGDGGCTCFISPPCSHCTHPGNLLNQEVDECWEPDELAAPAFDIMKSIRDMIGRP